jgi:DNA-binding MarR family transcriptional regulator
MQRLSSKKATAMTEPPELDLKLFLPYLVNVLASGASTRLAAVYHAKFGISIPEWRVIAHLAQHEKVSIREIYRRVDMDKSKVSRAAARLATQGFIENREHASDRRLVELSLTRKGRKLFSSIATLALAYEREFTAVLSPAEERQFRALLARLLAAMGKDF